MRGVWTRRQPPGQRARRRRLLRTAAMLAVAAGVVVPAAPAAAHPRLVSAHPEPRSVVAAPLERVALRFNETMDWELSRLAVQRPDGTSAVAAPGVFSPQEATLPLLPDATGPLLVTWLVVSLDAHPVAGQYVFTVGRGGGGTVGEAALASFDAAAGFSENRAGTDALAWLIRGGRSVEVVLLYSVLGILLVRLLVLRRAGGPALAGGPAATDERAYRSLSRLGLAAVVLTPALFLLYATRLTRLVADVSLGDVLSSPLATVWGAKALLWVAFGAAAVWALRRRAWSGEHDLVLLGLAASATAAFVVNTHALSGSPRLLWASLMWSHVVVTALWAGGLLALLVLVFPRRSHDEVWAATSRFSRIMTPTVLVVFLSGLPMLVELAGNWKGMWCSQFGVTAGFKLTVVAVALTVGLINNRLVAAQRRLDSPLGRRQGRRVRSVASLRRIVAAEVVVLLGVLVLSASLGETELPTAFAGQILPGQAQELVQPGFFGTGCR